MSTKRYQIEEFLLKTENIPILDVRSPGEYTQGHIPGAISFPLFDNEERAIIGTLYKQKGRREAIKKGLEIIGPKMLLFTENAEKLNASTLGIYCWRGGMRSESMAWLLSLLGLNLMVLDKGYKAYRNHMIAFFEKKLPLRVITGYTGSKKTHLLNILKEKGEQVVDIEGFARHQGSSFGNMKSVSQPTTEEFQNSLFYEFSKMDINKPIWIEDESMNIGRVNMPEGLFKRKTESPHFLIRVEKKQRVQFLIDDYKELSKEQLIKATWAISKKLGKENTEDAINYINDGNLAKAAEIILTYYDERYKKSLSKKIHLVRDTYHIDLSTLENFAIELIHKTKNDL
ncbi:MAG: tRNA 2-selenouridine(34) synthase MnmH [Cyclobacteriaceae bacterium]|nr:tRNA 2-selenouridine(34) synthase MnmH [Cyclobacteriaceae bacterium]